MINFLTRVGGFGVLCCITAFSPSLCKSYPCPLAALVVLGGVGGIVHNVVGLTILPCIFEVMSPPIGRSDCLGGAGSVVYNCWEIDEFDV